MSAGTASTAAPGARPSLRTKVAAVLVLACLAALAAYAMFSGPTTVRSPRPRAAPAQTTAPAHREEAPESGEGD